MSPTRDERPNSQDSPRPADPVKLKKKRLRGRTIGGRVEKAWDAFRVLSTAPLEFLHPPTLDTADNTEPPLDLHPNKPSNGEALLLESELELLPRLLEEADAADEALKNRLSVRLEDLIRSWRNVKLHRWDQVRSRLQESSVEASSIDTCEYQMRTSTCT